MTSSSTSTAPDPEESSIDDMPELVGPGPTPIMVDADAIDATVRALTTATHLQARRIAVDWGRESDPYYDAVYDQLDYLCQLTQSTATLIEVAVTLGDLANSLFVVDYMPHELVPDGAPWPSSPRRKKP